MSKKVQTGVLCRECRGNGVIKIPGGVSVCPRCHGECRETVEPNMSLRYECALRVFQALASNHELWYDQTPVMWTQLAEQSWRAADIFLKAMPHEED